MPATIPFVTAVYAAVLALLGSVLTVNVIVNRVRSSVDSGDGGVATMAQAIRAHGNFAEQAPMAIIVIAFAEAAGTRPLFVNILGIALVAARLAAAYALNRSLAVTLMRQIGATVTALVVAAASAAILLVAAGIAP
jgi:uncharacterized membrane protein YecN with MAPEG domain